MTNHNPELFDVVVVGLGPSGMLASHALLGSGLRVLLVDRSAQIGGAAFATDVNLQNIMGFPPQSDFGERTLGSRAAADALVREAYEVLHDYGLPYKPPDATDVYSYAVDEPTLRGVVDQFRARVEADAVTCLRLHTTLDRVDPGGLRRWQLALSDSTRSDLVETDHLLVATGKLSATWLTEFLTRLGIVFEHKSTFALGFRVEGLAASVNAAANGCENPKIRIRDQSVVTETFCWCKNGKVMAYDFGGAKLLDGEHFYGRPQVNSSFGVITTVELPQGASNTLASVAFSRYISALGEGRVLLQRLGDFRLCRPSTAQDMARNAVRPSLDDCKLCDLRSYFPSVVVDGFLALMAEIEARTPGAITDDTLIYAPILERVFPEIALDTHLQSNRQGIHLIGDCSGKGVGVAPAVVMGLAAARKIRTEAAAHASAAPAAPAPRIGREQVEALARDGAICLPGLITPAFVALLNRGVERNIEAPSPRFRDFTGLHDAQHACAADHWSWPHIPEYRTFFAASGIAGAAGALLQCEQIRLLEDDYLQKMPHTRTVTPWHQDQPFHALSGRWISFWIALDRIAADDALEVVRGSHLTQQMYVSRALSSARAGVPPLPPDTPGLLPEHGAEPAAWQIMRWSLEPGDAIAFDPFVIHGNRGNSSPSRARRFVARLAAEDCAYAAPTLPCATLIPGHGLADGERLRGPMFPLLWRRDGAALDGA